MDAAGFLEFQRDFLSNGKSRATTNHKQVTGICQDVCREQTVNLDTSGAVGRATKAWNMSPESPSAVASTVAPKPQ